MLTLNQFNELEEFAQAEGTEWGEQLSTLLSCYDASSNADQISDEFKDALEKELLTHYQCYKEQFVVVKRKRTVEYKELVPIEEVEDTDETVW